MSRILITPAELRSSSQNFQRSSDEIKQLMNKLNTELNKLDASWDGAAQDRLYQTWQGQGRKSFEQMAQQCQQFSQKIKTVADQMEQLDNQLASQMNL